MTLRVLHVRSTIGMYGAESVVFNLLRQAKADGEHYSLICIEGMTPGSELLAEKASAYAEHVYRFVTNKRLDLNVIRQIRQKLCAYDVVHTHDYKSLMYISCARLFFSRLRVFHHMHGALGNSRMERIYAAIEKYLIRFVDGVITVSDVQRDTLRQQNKHLQHLKQIDNGVFVPAISPTGVAGVQLRIIMVARFTPEKDHYLALDVLASLLKEGIDAKLTLLGDGPLLENIRQRSIELALNSAVVFAGFSRDVSSWLSQADVLLISSRTEGMPMAMLEAMAAGLAVVSTPVGQIPQIINTAECGCLGRDTPELAAHLSSLATQPAYRSQLGNKGRVYVEKHCSVAKQMADIHAFYGVAAC